MNEDLERLLEKAYKDGACNGPTPIRSEGWVSWRYYNRAEIEALSTNRINSVSIVPLNEWESISTAPTNVWLVCRNANKRVFEAMKCSTLKSYCWVDRAKLQRDPKEWNRALSLPEIENHE